MTPRRLSPICLALLIALAALLPAGAPAAGGPARAWLTTGDGPTSSPSSPPTLWPRRRPPRPRSPWIRRIGTHSRPAPSRRSCCARGGARAYTPPAPVVECEVRHGAPVCGNEPAREPSGYA